MITLDWGSGTDVGRVRRLNEDSLYAMPPLFVVADGMGGHAAGEVASATAIDVFRTLATLGPSLRRDDVVHAVRAANEAIVRTASLSEGTGGMGTTAVGLALVRGDAGDALCGFNVGDSRLYHFRDGHLRQVSVDHSYVQELVDAGEITLGEARSHPQRNVITRMLGGPDPAVPDVWALPAGEGDRYVVCSDGLTAEIDDETIARTLAEEDDPRAAVRRLIEQALAGGGRDNVSVIVVDVVRVADDAAPVDTAPRPDTVVEEDTRPRGLLLPPPDAPGAAPETVVIEPAPLAPPTPSGPDAAAPDEPATEPGLVTEVPLGRDADAAPTDPAPPAAPTALIEDVPGS